MASASITFVLNRLGELAVKEAALLRGVDDDIRLLRDKLEWLQTFIQEADQERRKGANQYVGLWVRQTRDVAYEVEDVLDEFLRRVDLDRLGLGLPAWRRWIKVATSCTTQVSVRHDLKDRMDVIKNRLKGISDNVDKYRINHLQSSTSSATNPAISAYASWYADEDEIVVGFKNEYQDLVHKLRNGDKQRNVVSIVGESGIGKSTLAWKVYDSPAIRDHFDVRVWISVPPHIRDMDILFFICKRLCIDNDDKEGLHDALSRQLNEKSYLVMVDGLVNFTNWNAVLPALPNNDKGSRVMIITRLEDKEAADVDPKVPPLRVSHLKEEESNELFRRKVFGSKNQFCHKVFSNASCSATDEEQMEKVCKEVYEITQGLPLAIVVLAGLLRTKCFTEWDKLLTYLKSNEETKRVKRILALCFDDLPSRLKSCFLYFAGMPENVILKARRLVRLWAAEGFLKAKKGKTMEDVGQGYLKELIARGMIHLVKQDSNGGIWLIAIHDRLHAFAQSEAQEESFLEVHDNAEILAPVSVRRLYLQNYVQSYVPMETSFPKLRSVLCHFAEETRRYSEEPPQHTNGDTFRNQNTNNDLRHHALHFLPRSNFLRVVDLRGLRVQKVPKAIGNLIHVRYLCLRSRFLATLPSSIRNLINLQTLDIKRTEVVDIAQEFWQITTLRHILAEKLRLPKSVGVLNNMQTLDGVVCSDPWDNISPLHKMINLRYLAISGVKSQHRIALSDAFMKLESLIYLQIIGDEIQFDIFTRFILRRLQILELYGKITISSSKKEERYTLPNLTRLVLKSSQVNQSFINKIGELPSLTELVLSEESYHGEELIFSESGFRSLTSMVLKDLSKLSTLKMRSNSIARVKKITVSGCSRMVIKPDGEHENLKEIVVSNMPENWKMEAIRALHAKINRVPIRTKTEDMMDAIQRDGKWRAGIVAADLYQL